MYCNGLCWASAINATDAFIYVYGNAIDVDDILRILGVAGFVQLAGYEVLGY